MCIGKNTSWTKRQEILRNSWTDTFSSGGKSKVYFYSQTRALLPLFSRANVLSFVRVGACECCLVFLLT